MSELLELNARMQSLGELGRRWGRVGTPSDTHERERDIDSIVKRVETARRADRFSSRVEIGVEHRKRAETTAEVLRVALSPRPGFVLYGRPSQEQTPPVQQQEPRMSRLATEVRRRNVFDVKHGTEEAIATIEALKILETGLNDPTSHSTTVVKAVEDAKRYQWYLVHAAKKQQTEGPGYSERVAAETALVEFTDLFHGVVNELNEEQMKLKATLSTLTHKSDVEDAWVGYELACDTILSRLPRPGAQPDSFAHFGILGMKWGVRRYQNPDGSRTPAGQKRAEQQQRVDAAMKEQQWKQGISHTSRQVAREIYGDFVKQNHEMNLVFDQAMRDLSQTINDPQTLRLMSSQLQGQHMQALVNRYTLLANDHMTPEQRLSPDGKNAVLLSGVLNPRTGGITPEAFRGPVEQVDKVLADIREKDKKYMKHSSLEEIVDSDILEKLEKHPMTTVPVFKIDLPSSWDATLLKSDELVHYGILGMKWGVRRPRNPDTGRVKQSAESIMARKIATKDISTMTNAELQQVIQRMQLEKQYSNLTQKEKNVGQQIVSEVSKEIGKAIIKDIIVMPAVKALVAAAKKK